MKAVHDPRQRAHDPRHFLSMGQIRPNPDQPARIDALLAGLEAAGAEVIGPADYGLGPVAAIHTAEYLHFLRTIHARWITLDGASDEVIPNAHPDRRAATYPDGPVGQAGWHMADTACPIGAHTWEAAVAGAQVALTATELVLEGERAAYALCRPPGHHAFADQAGGFCFLNNSAIAAQRLLATGRRPAVLDVDVHHGNGTQGIFHARGDVLTVSIHRDPIDYYPFFWGHACERGAGAGEGANLNLPLPRGTGDDGYARARRRLARIAPSGPTRWWWPSASTRMRATRCGPRGHHAGLRAHRRAIAGARPADGAGAGGRLSPARPRRQSRRAFSAGSKGAEPAGEVNA
jgi:acetoin utilization deacetylase AcuC-like enzyme